MVTGRQRFPVKSGWRVLACVLLRAFLNVHLLGLSPLLECLREILIELDNQPRL